MYKVEFKKYIGKHLMTGWTAFKCEGDLDEATKKFQLEFPELLITDIKITDKQS